MAADRAAPSRTADDRTPESPSEVGDSSPRHGAEAQRGGGAERSSGDASASLPQMVLALLRELPGLVSDRVELLSLELKRAGRALAQIVALVVAAAILGVTLWLVSWGALIALLIVEWGWHWLPALMLVAAVNAGAVWFALQRVRTLAALLTLPATQRHLTLSRPVSPAAPTTPDATAPLAPTGGAAR